MATHRAHRGCGCCWFAYDNYRITGHPLRLPYREYYEQYETVPPFWVVPISTIPRVFRHSDFEMMEKGAREAHNRARSLRLLVDRPLDWLTLLRHYYGNLIWLLPVVVFAHLLWRSKRMRFAVVLAVVIGTASLIEVWWYPHYGAPFAAALFILVAQSMRYLQQWKHAGVEAGRFLVRAMPIAVMVVMVASEARGIATHRTMFRHQVQTLRDSAEKELFETSLAYQVIFVRNTGIQSPRDEWIYNRADMDGAPLIWAHDMGRIENGRLLRYYAGRSFWLFKPDDESWRFIPY